MEPQDVQAKNTARTKRTTKVSRQSSPCRFSNCSKREVMAARWSACCVERPGIRGSRCFSSSMKVDGTLQSQESSADTSHTPYRFAHKQQRRPGLAGAASDLVFAPPADRPKRGFSLR